MNEPAIVFVFAEVGVTWVETLQYRTMGRCFGGGDGFAQWPPEVVPPVGCVCCFGKGVGRVSLL